MKHMHSRAIIIASVFFALACPPVALATTIHSVTSASADSGGNVVGEGGRVVTGSQSASASVYTNIFGGSSGGTIDISVTTEHDGEVQTEERHINVPPGTSVSVSVGTSSANTGASSKATSVPAPQASSMVEKTKQLVQQATAQIPALVPTSATVFVETSGTTTNDNNLLAVNSSVDAELSVGNWWGEAYHNIRSFFSSIFSIFSL